MNQIIPFAFEKLQIRVVAGDDGEPLFVGKDVCDALGYIDATTAIRTHCKGVQILHPLKTGGGVQKTRVLTEPDMMRLVVNSTLPAAQDFERLVFEEILPSIRKTGHYSAKHARPQTLSRNQVAASILLLRSAAEDLKFAPSAVLGGYQRLETQLGVTGLLPAYAIDAPSSATGGSSDETKAAGDLLEKFGVGLSAIAFNRLLVQHGIVEERERPSSKGGTKKFKVCVNLEYGKNLTSPTNPRETQPHWYVNRFMELVDLVMPEKPTVAIA